jgi:PhnB protein
MALNPYLIFNGNCEAAFKFYERVFGGKIDAMMLFEGTPAAKQMPPDWLKKIIHAQITIGDGDVLMASDGSPGEQRTMQGFSISFSVKTAAEAERIFAALAEGGTVRMPIAETFFAERFGMVADQFGAPWMIVCLKPMPS